MAPYEPVTGKTDTFQSMQDLRLQLYWRYQGWKRSLLKTMLPNEPIIEKLCKDLKKTNTGRLLLSEFDKKGGVIVDVRPSHSLAENGMSGKLSAFFPDVDAIALMTINAQDTLEFRRRQMVYLVHALAESFIGKKNWRHADIEDMSLQHMQRQRLIEKTLAWVIVARTMHEVQYQKTDFVAPSKSPEEQMLGVLMQASIDYTRLGWQGDVQKSRFAVARDMHLAVYWYKNEVQRLTQTGKKPVKTAEDLLLQPPYQIRDQHAHDIVIQNLLHRHLQKLPD